MSLNIANGYILPKMSLTELNHFAQDYRRQIRVQSKQLVIERLGNMIMGYIDFVSLPENKRTLFTEMNRELFLNKAIDQSPIFTAYEKMQEKEQRIIAEKVREPDYDFLCDLVIFPLEDCLLAMLFAEQADYIKLFESMPDVKKYSYWNNTDRPDDISEYSWESRKLKWKEALDITGIPSLDGFNISCYVQLPFINPEDVYDYIQKRFNLDNRTDNYASKIVTLEKYAESVNQTDSLWGTQKLYKEAITFLKSEEGQRQYESEKEALLKTFKANVSLEDLTNPLANLVNS